MEIQGKVHEIFDTVQVSEKFKKREFIIIVEKPTWTEYVKFVCVQDGTSLMDGVKPGDEIVIHFNVGGRKWEKDGKVSYFNQLTAWKIEKGVEQDIEPDRHDDDLPF